MKKRHIAISLLTGLLCIALLASCQQGPVEETLPPVVPTDGDGAWNGAMDTVGAIEREIAAAEEPILLPVFIDEYPTGQEGLLVEATEELYELVEARLAAYLKLAGVDYDALPAHAVERAEGCCFRDDVPGTDGAGASAKHIAVGVMLDTDITVDETITLAAIEDDPFYAAAWDYLGLEDPMVEHTIKYRLDGTVGEVEYTLYNRGKSVTETVLNRSFFALHITFWPNNTVSIKITDNSHLNDAVETRQLLGYDDALAQAAIDIDNAGEKTLWSISYSKTAEPGYYVPVYEIYTLEPAAEGESPSYQITEIPATK